MRIIFLKNLLVIILLLFTCMFFSCKKAQKTTVTYDFTWTTYLYYGGISVINFHSNAPSGSSFLWNFGDGSSSTDSVPRHEYDIGGIYYVTLVINGDSVHTITKTVPAGPRSISCSGTQMPDSAIHFYSNVVDDSSFLWNFGDGTTSTDSTPNHSYVADGSYTVTLTISSNPASVVTKTIIIYKDPVYTHLMGGLRLWHHSYRLFRSDGSITYYPKPDVSIAIGYINPIEISFSAVTLYFVYTSDSVLTFGSSYIDNTGNTHSDSLYYHYLIDFIYVETYDRIGAGGYSKDYWHSP